VEGARLRRAHLAGRGSDRHTRYSGKLGPYINKLIERGTKAGTPTDPGRFADADLLERKSSYGLAGYALQFMLDTSPSDLDRYPLKLRDLIIHDIDPR
jgi:hypothetical protein